MFEWKSIRFALIRHLYWRIRKPRIYVLLGAPGSGKGTVAKPLARKLKAAPLSTGDIFRRERANQTPLGQRLASYMDNGRLVPDALVLAVIREELKQTKYRNGVVFDGFPRTVLQARGLDMILDSLGLAVEGALLLDPDEQVLIERLSNRLTCSNTQCGQTYHLVSKPPRTAGTCDICNAALYQRRDDQPEVISARMATYKRDTAPVCQYYNEKLRVVKPSGEETETQVFAKVEAAIDGTPAQ